MRAERLNKIIEIMKAERYLEIGVCQGETFFKVEARHKVAVDPAFLFDVNAAAAPHHVFHQTASDDFFYMTKDKPFDVIFLDGLHTYEQTLRDFLNSLVFSHDKTVWLLDDTLPNDNFAALPDMERCYRLRRGLGNDDWAWMGDVYKVVFFVRAMMKFYDYRSFKGHGQTVIWKDSVQYKERDALPVATLGIMTYEDLLENIGMMNVSDDSEIYAALTQFARPRLRRPTTPCSAERFR